MPFAKEFYDVYKRILAAAKLAAGDSELVCTRLDEIKRAGRITNDLAREIQDSALCIADISKNNPNVLWEVGYAMALGKPIILITQNPKLPFDVHDVRAIHYRRKSLSETLDSQLTDAISQTLKHPEERVSVSPSPSFFPEFGDGMREIINLLRTTRQRLFVMCDFAGYAHFSELDLFKEYWHELGQAIRRCHNPKILLYDPSLYRPARETQFPNFDRLREGPQYKKFRQHWELPEFEHREGFMRQLDSMESKWRAELAKVAEVKTLAGAFWMFHWLNETSHVVYSIQPTEDPNEEMVFQSHDEHLASALRDQFLNKVWPSAFKSGPKEHASPPEVLGLS